MSYFEIMAKNLKSFLVRGCISWKHWIDIIYYTLSVLTTNIDGASAVCCEYVYNVCFFFFHVLVRTITLVKRVGQVSEKGNFRDCVPKTIASKRTRFVFAYLRVQLQSMEWENRVTETQCHDITRYITYWYTALVDIYIYMIDWLHIHIVILWY